MNEMCKKILSRREGVRKIRNKMWSEKHGLRRGFGDTYGARG